MLKAAGLAFSLLLLSGCALEKTETAAVVEVDLVPRLDGVYGPLQAQIAGKKDESAPSFRVLIYHTHTYEAYCPDEEDPYVPTETWRTAEDEWNVTAVGRKLSEELRKLGFDVLHDDTAFEPPDLDSAYERSLAAVENYAARGEEFDLYIDLHRDAYAPSQKGKNTVNAYGKQAAKIMFLVGTGEGTYKGKPYDPKPEWEENLALAQSLTEKINAICPGLCRPVTVRAGRYNQHISPRALLIEAGNNENTLEETLNAMPILARAIAQIL